MSSKGDSSDEAINQINEAVNDGGGCTEAWEAMNSLRAENNVPTPNRRAVIKLLGVGTASIAGISAFSDLASADTPDTPNKSSFDFERITGAEANKMVAAALRSKEYKDLHKTLRKEKQYTPKVSDAKVIEVKDPEGVPHQIVSFPLKQVGKPRKPAEGTKVTADMAITLRNGEALSGKGGTFTSGPRNPETKSTPVSTITYKAVNGTVESSTAEAVIEEEPTETEFSTAAVSTSCFACSKVGDAVCAIGCGIGITAVCAGTAVANLAAGFACEIIAGALCTILTAAQERYTGAGCGVDFGVEYACYYAGYCDKPFSG